MFWSFGEPKTCQGGVLERGGSVFEGDMAMRLAGLAKAEKGC